MSDERYYRRDGTPYPSWKEWTADHEGRIDYKRVAETTLPDGTWISTVWLGLNHQFDPDGPPLIFETMAFPVRGDWQELWCERYSTEAEALAGHERICKTRPWEET